MKCKKCGEEKTEGEFYKCSRRRTYFIDKTCKLCRRAIAGNRRQERSEQEVNIEQTHKCVKCGKVKPFSEFHRDNALPKRIRNDCKECVKGRVMSSRQVARMKAKQDERLDKLRVYKFDSVLSLFEKDEQRFLDVLEYI